MSTSKVKFPGNPFSLGGEVRIIPSLSLRQFREHEEALNTPASETESLNSTANRFLPVILDAVQRNYPEVTEDNLLDWLDLSNLRDVMLTVQGASGMKPVTEVAATGE